MSVSMVITPLAIEKLRAIATHYYQRTLQYFPKPHAWKTMTEDTIWKYFVYQVSVVGGSSSYERLLTSEAAQRDLNFDFLGKLSIEERRSVINRILRMHGVRYVSSELSKCRKTSAVVKNYHFLSKYAGGPIGYLSYLSTLATEAERIEAVQCDASYIKLKGARDLLAEFGLIKEAIALDTRVLGILSRLGCDISPEVQTSEAQYTKLQRELIERVAKPAGMTGIELDRILYRNYDEILSKL